VNPVLLYCASGESLYLGAALLLFVVVISLFLTHRRLLLLRNIATWLALALIFMASPPFSLIVDAIFGVVFLLWFIAWNRATTGPGWRRLRTAVTTVLFFMLWLFPAIEFSHRRMPVIEGEVSDHLVVIGDSISSGLGSRVPPWPAVMQQMTRVDVRNLSRPGATVSDGVAMAEKITAEDHLVLIELGGNDLIAGAPSDGFARGLEQVFAKLALPGRTVVMFELPLLPDRIAFGRIQRRLAAKYRVSLIPKRYFTRVIAGHEATSDGLHLTDVGSRRMAAVVTYTLFPLLKTQVDRPTTPATHL
jgi:lysophospholipase L1-like esterase